VHEPDPDATFVSGAVKRNPVGLRESGERFDGDGKVWVRTATARLVPCCLVLCEIVESRRRQELANLCIGTSIL